MKTIKLLIAVSLLCLSCTPTVTKEIRKSAYPTHNELIATSIRETKIPMNFFTAKDTIAIWSIEFGKAVDLPVNYLVEDNLLEKFAKRNIGIVERDPEIIRHFYSESQTRYTYLFDTLWNLNLLAGLPLQRATKIITYRVLDCGIKSIEPIKVEAGKAGGCCIFGGGAIMQGMLQRKAETKLAVRIINGRTGDILWSDYVTGEATDTIPPDLLLTLAGKRLTFYPHTLPNRSVVEAQMVAPPVTVGITPVPITPYYYPSPAPSRVAPPGMAPGLQMPKLEVTKFRGANNLQWEPWLTFYYTKTGGSLMSLAPSLNVRFETDFQLFNLSLNLWFDSEALLSKVMPVRIYEYAGIGIGYTVFHADYYGWDGFELEMPISWGVKYYLFDRLSLNAGMRHHILLTNDLNSYSDWTFGIGLH